MQCYNIFQASVWRYLPVTLLPTDFVQRNRSWDRDSVHVLKKATFPRSRADLQLHEAPLFGPPQNAGLFLGFDSSVFCTYILLLINLHYKFRISNRYGPQIYFCIGSGNDLNGSAPHYHQHYWTSILWPCYDFPTIVPNPAQV